MCGIAGVMNLDGQPIDGLGNQLNVMNHVQRHRGPDGHATWEHPHRHLGFAHVRLSIIDLVTGEQPMTDGHGNWISYNGEVYNYVELRQELGGTDFRTTSDTEVILRAYVRWGEDCVTHLRGMFAFTIWDEREQKLFCARDRFGIKPFYYSRSGRNLYFASEVKTLLPFIDRVATDLAGLKDYLAFQFCLAGKTLFDGVSELLPGHSLSVKGDVVKVRRYWEVYYEPDYHHTALYFEERIRDLIADSIRVHVRADVAIGAYVSGGLDSGIVAAPAAGRGRKEFEGFNGKFSGDDAYDESRYARELADWREFPLFETDITERDFVESIGKVVYHLDYPAAGPGSFPQYVVSKMAREHKKVLLGGQGGDEIFGGYTRYLVAYFEQCIKGAINGTMNSGNFIVTYQSIIPNLVALRQYKPMLKEFWSEGLFDDLDRRYFRLINRASSLGDAINWDALGRYEPFETFRSIFHGDNVQKESYFDSMTHFDFKTLLPALLQVEDRVSMAHGLESRVPFLDHPLVEFAATIPADVKFKDGNMKHVLRSAMGNSVPQSIIDRTDKMGFPVPLHLWFRESPVVRDFVRDTLTTQSALGRGIVDNRQVLAQLESEPEFGRGLWGLLCLELWQQNFHDRAADFKNLAARPTGEGVLS